MNAYNIDNSSSRRKYMTMTPLNGHHNQSLFCKAIYYHLVLWSCNINQFLIHLTNFSIKSCIYLFVSSSVDDEGTKCMKQMMLYSRNIDIIYPKIDADPIAGSELNNRDKLRNVGRCSYIVLVSIVRQHGVILGSTAFVRTINEWKYT